MGVLIALVLFFLLAAAMSVPGAWILMVLLGALAHSIDYLPLAIGFWSSYLIVVIITLFVNFARKTS